MEVFHEQFPSLVRDRDVDSLKDTIPHIMTNYTIFLFSLQDIKMQKTMIEAPRIGICSNTLEMQKSKVTASRHGCESDDGFGRGKKFQGCAASGGAHGGTGGYGGIESTDKN